jgi:alkanesulfonate monooxygenase SsuD/methylene tetrahydromethanopterin reductase-like flavin-dependent oxidoreductase (luciferase family)
MIRQARMGTMAQAKTAGLKDYERRYRELLGELSEIGFIRSGSVAPRYNYCGKANCRCHADPPQPHGPYFQWTAKVGGKTVNRRLSAREAELYQEWIGNDRRLRALLEELRAVAEQATNLILEQVVKV